MGEEDKLEPTEAKEVEVDNISSKLARKRKKQLYNSIKHLMEFWFSDVNLGKDRFLSQLIYVDPWIDLEIFLKFNKLRTLTTDLNDVIKALRKSEMIQVSEDGRKVCRITPFGQKQDVDACTIYVEQILPDAEHDWLKSVFSEYGPIDYISLPRFKATQKPKGFAFIEFKNPDSANRAIEAFRAKGCCLSPQMDPDKLVSIATFEKDEKHPDFKNSGSFKLEQEETEGDIANEELAQKKSKKDKNVKLESENERKEEEMKDNKSESDIKDDEIVKNTKKGQRSCSSKSDHNLEEEMIEDVKLDDDIKEKKSYKRKRKSSSVNDSVIEEEEEEEVELNKPFKRPKSTSSFEIDNNEPIKTKKGKRISNTSLEMEEGDPTSIEVDAGEGVVKPEKEKRRSDISEEMEEVEQQDKEEDEIDLENVQDIDGEGDENEDGEKKSKRKRKKKHKRNLNAISFGLQIMPKVEWKRLRNKYLNLQKLKMQHLKQHLRQYQWGEQHTSNWYSHNYYEYENKKVETDQNNKEQKKGLQYTPGVIIKVILDEPVVDVKGIKSKARIHPEVRYVDATEGDKELYLRVGGPELADQVITTKHWSSMELLKGKEEKQYWEKILKDREEKFSKKIRVNQRGRDKLLKKAEKIQGKHVGFDER